MDRKCVKCIRCNKKLTKQDSKTFCLSCSMDDASEMAELESKKQLENIKCPNCKNYDKVKVKEVKTINSKKEFYLKKFCVCKRCKKDFVISLSET